MNFLPVFYNITDKPCLVVGGGAIAARKVELLLKAGGRVRLVAPEIGERVREMAGSQNLEFEQREFHEDDLNDAVCVIAATDNKALNADISRLSQTRNIPVNVVDSPGLCSFIMPSMIDRDPVQIAISTGGVSPVLARMLRSKLETNLVVAVPKRPALEIGADGPWQLLAGFEGFEETIDFQLDGARTIVAAASLSDTQQHSYSPRQGIQFQ